MSGSKRIYKHTGPGHCIGSCIIAIADTQKEAEHLIEQSLCDNGLVNEPLNVYCIGKTNKSRVVYENNGDY